MNSSRRDLSGEANHDPARRPSPGAGDGASLSAATPAAAAPRRLLGAAVVIALLAAPALIEAVQLHSLLAPDAWLHLRLGVRFLQTRAVPHTLVLSQRADWPWVDSSWLLEVVLALLYKVVGLRAIPLMVMAEKTILAASLLALARSRRACFAAALAITALASALIAGGDAPLLATAICLTLEFYLLARFRRSGGWSAIAALALLFLLWANLHQGFLYGVIVLALYCAALLANRVLQQPSAGEAVDATALRGTLTMAGVALLATFATPYGWGTWTAALSELYSRTAIRHLPQMQAMEFRSAHDFLALLFVMGTLLILGHRRFADGFLLGALVLSMIPAFRHQRDVPLLVICSVAALAEALQPAAAGELVPSSSPRWRWAAACVLACILAAATFFLPASEGGLARRAGVNLPIAACDYLNAAHPPAPLFNNPVWGGFLTWYAPQYPVAIDGRVGVQGDAYSEEYYRLLDGKARMENFPAFVSANTFLLDANSGVAQALTKIPQLQAQFRVVYRDDVAVVLVRNRSLQ